MTRHWTRDLVDDLAANARRDRADAEAERAAERDPYDDDWPGVVDEDVLRMEATGEER